MDALLVARVRALAHQDPTPAALSDLVERLVQVHEEDEGRLVRIGLDLHDGPLQEIAVVTSELHFLREQLTLALGGDTPAVRTVDGMIGRLGSLATDVRGLAAGSRHATAAQSSLSQWLAATADLYADVFEVDLVFEPSREAVDSASLSVTLRTAVDRVVQNALANAAQHSGAYRVQLSVRVDPGRIEVEVLDDGRGFDVDEALRRCEATGHLGLVGMRYRAEALGGSLVLSSAPGGPTSVRLALPVRVPALEPDHTLG